MTVKSVIDIDVNDARFKSFMELYEKYNGALAKAPGMWKKVGEEQDHIAKSFQSMTAAMMAMAELSRSTDDEDDKRVKRLGVTEKLWTAIAKSSKATAGAILDIGGGLLRWGSTILGVATGGSLYGLDRMAHSVFDQRRSAIGLGLSIGEQKAFANSFGRFVDTGSLLGGVSTAAGDITKQWPLTSLGINPNGGDTASTSVDLLKRVRELTRSTQENLWGPLLLQAKHLADFGFDIESLRRVNSASPGEFDRQLGTYRAGAKGFNIDDNTAQTWTNFVQKLDEAGGKIFKVFVDGLRPLEPSLAKLTDAIVGLFGRVADNGEVKKGIDTFADWISTLSGTIAKPEFLSRMDAFITDLSVIGDVVGKVASGFKATGTWIGETAAKNSMADEKVIDWTKHLWYKGIANLEANRYGIPANLIGAIINRESGWNPDAKSSAGAMGLMQLMPDTARAMGVTDPFSGTQSIAGGTKYLSQLLKKYHGDVGEALAAYNWGPGNLDKDIAKYGRDWMSHLPAETRNYVNSVSKAAGLNITITLNNQTGASPVVAVAQQTQ